MEPDVLENVIDTDTDILPPVDGEPPIEPPTNGEMPPDQPDNQPQPTPDEPGFEKKINSEVYTTIKFDTDIDFDKNKNVDINVKSQSDVEGNLAELVLDAEALGINTLVEVDTSILTVEEKLSSVVLSVISSSDAQGGITPPPNPDGQEPLPTPESSVI